MAESKQEDQSTLDALEPLRRDPEHVRQIIKKVLILEQNRLYQQRPRVNEEIIQIIKEEVQ